MNMLEFLDLDNESADKVIAVSKGKYPTIEAIKDRETEFHFLRILMLGLATAAAVTHNVILTPIICSEKKDRIGMWDADYFGVLFRYVENHWDFILTNPATHEKICIKDISKCDPNKVHELMSDTIVAQLEMRYAQKETRH